MAESSRERILVAAAQVIADKGAQSFGVKEVAAAAGVTAQLLYYHFPNRDALLRGALQFAAQQAPSVNLLRTDHNSSGFDAVRNALLAEFDDEPAVRNLNVIWNEAAVLSSQLPDLRAELLGVTARWDEQVTIGVLRGLADRSIDTDLEPAVVAQVLTSTVEGLSQRWLARSITQEEARATLDTLLDAFRATRSD